MNTATRINYSEPSFEPVVFNCVTGTTPQHPDVVRALPITGHTDRWEEMTPNSEGSHREWKSFQHYKCKAEDPIAMRKVDCATNQWAYEPNWYLGRVDDPYCCGELLGNQGETSWPFGEPGRWLSGLPEFRSVQADGSIVAPPVGLDAHIQAALGTMLPTIKPDLSLVNSLIELKDLKRPIANVLQFLRTPKGWKSYVIAQKVGRESKRLDQAVASAFLEWKFNYAPLISDICAVYTALSQTERRVNDLITRAGRPQRRHYGFNWVEHVDVFDQKSDEGFLAPGYSLAPLTRYQLVRDVRYDSSSFHAMIEYNYDYTRFQLALARVSGFLDALGVNLNPRIVWNAIPWSFVIDWVIGVGRWLDQFTVHNLEPVVNIRRFLWSVHRSRRIQVWKQISASDVAGVNRNRIAFPVVYETAYRRQVGLPSRSSIALSGVSGMEFTLGAALVIARRPKRHHRGR